MLPNKDTVQTVRSMPDVWDGTTVITAVWTRVTDIDWPTILTHIALTGATDEAVL